MIVLAMITSPTVWSGEIGTEERTSLRTTAKVPTSFTIRDGTRTVLEYRTMASPIKPYVRELSTPGGAQILRDSPADHKHHHGLMKSGATRNSGYFPMQKRLKMWSNTSSV